MIDNFPPSPSLCAAAPAVTAIVFVGDDECPANLMDLALGVDTGEIVPLSEWFFAIDGQSKTAHPNPTGDGLNPTDAAGLLRCEADADTFTRVASLTLLQVNHELEVRRRLRSTCPAPTASTAPTISRDTSLEALLSAMDEAEARRNGADVP